MLNGTMLDISLHISYTPLPPQPSEALINLLLRTWLLVDHFLIINLDDIPPNYCHRVVAQSTSGKNEDEKIQHNTKQGYRNAFSGPKLAIKKR